MSLEDVLRAKSARIEMLAAQLYHQTGSDWRWSQLGVDGRNRYRRTAECLLDESYEEFSRRHCVGGWNDVDDES